MGLGNKGISFLKFDALVPFLWDLLFCPFLDRRWCDCLLTLGTPSASDIDRHMKRIWEMHIFRFLMVQWTTADFCSRIVRDRQNDELPNAPGLLN